jgi:hypothetical protein
VTLIEQRERGERARRILEDPLVIEAFASIARTIEDGWKNSEADDHAGRHNAYLMHRLLENFRDHFARLVRTGDAAAKQLLAIEKEKR